MSIIWKLHYGNNFPDIEKLEITIGQPVLQIYCDTEELNSTYLHIYTQPLGKQQKDHAIVPPPQEKKWLRTNKVKVT